MLLALVDRNGLEFDGSGEVNDGSGGGDGRSGVVILLVVMGRMGESCKPVF